MCFRFPKPKPPKPPPLPPPPAPPVEAPKPPPEPEDIVKDVNPKVREAKSKKAKGEYAQGTGSLRIPLNPQVTGQADPGAATGGINV